MSLEHFNRTDDLFSLCGLNCGLCGYRLQGNCNGCFKDSPCAKTCPMAPCSVRHGNLQYCFECSEYPCKHYEGFDSYDTMVLHRNQRRDMLKAKEGGMEAYHAEQRAKKGILNRLLEGYDDASKDVFFCLMVNMLELKDLEAVLSAADQNTEGLTRREKAVYIDKLLRDCAAQRGIHLENRRW